MMEYTLIMIEGKNVTDIYLSEMVKAGYPPMNILLIKKKSQDNRIKLISRFIGEKKIQNLYSSHKDLREKPKKNKLDKILGKIIPEEVFCIEDLNNVKTHFKELNSFTVFADSINSKEVVDFLDANIRGAILTAGGGILRKEILSLSKIRFINIHSGLVPHYRGSDNFFYSLLYNDIPGFSIFYIDSGVDTGNVIYQRESQINIKNKNLIVFDKMDVFKTLKGYMIPYLKIRTLIYYLDYNKKENNFDMMNLPTKVQESQEGRIFFIMHEEFKESIIEKII